MIKLGAGGQKFIERCVPKIAELRARFPDKDIQADGGVGPQNVDVCACAGKPKKSLPNSFLFPRTFGRSFPPEQGATSSWQAPPSSLRLTQRKSYKTSSPPFVPHKHASKPRRAPPPRHKKMPCPTFR